MLFLLIVPFLAACNDEWKEEQYEHYISFKAPLNDNGVTAVYVPFTRHDDNGQPLYGRTGLSHYELPVIVSAVALDVDAADTVPQFQGFLIFTGGSLAAVPACGLQEGVVRDSGGLIE
jgi:hypothetical protein